MVTAYARKKKTQSGLSHWRTSGEGKGKKAGRAQRRGTDGTGRRERKRMMGRGGGCRKSTSKLTATKQERKRASRGERPVHKAWGIKTRLGAIAVCFQSTNLTPFPSSLCLCFKTIPSAKPFIRKVSFYTAQFH